MEIRVGTSDDGLALGAIVGLVDGLDVGIKLGRLVGMEEGF